MQKFKKLLGTSIIVASVLAVYPVHARTDVIMEENGYELRFDVDKNRAIDILGLPFGGDYLYSARQGVLYVGHPDEEDTYFISLANLYKEIPQAEVVKIGPAPKQFGVETTEWRIKFSLRSCASVHASRPAGEDTNLNAADFININALLSYIYVLEPDVCTYYRLSPVSGSIIGLPLWSNSNQGESRVTGIVHNELDAHILPKDARPFTQEVRVRFLARNLDEKRKAIFDQTADSLPVEAQYRMVKQMLTEQLDPPNAGKPRHFTPPMLPN